MDLKEVSNGEMNTEPTEDNQNEDLILTGLKCPDCSNIFKTKRYLYRHIKNAHSEKPVVETKLPFSKKEATTGFMLCSCDKLLSSYTNFKNHVKKIHVHPESKVCPMCSKRFFFTKKWGGLDNVPPTAWTVNIPLHFLCPPLPTHSL